MKTIESWVQDMKSQGAGYANALVVIYSQNTSFIRHIKSALLCLLLGGLAGTLWAVLPKY